MQVTKMLNVGQLRAHDRHYVPKTVLRSINIVFCIAAAAMIGRLYVESNIGSDYSFAACAGVWFLIPLLVAVLWCGAAIAIQLDRKRPVHPGFSVSFHLVLWLALAGAGSFMTAASFIALLSSGYWHDTVQDYSTIWAPYSSFWNNGYNFDNPISPTKAPGFSQWATSSTLVDIRDHLDYEYRASAGVTSVRTFGSPDYRCPNWDSCALRNAAYDLVHGVLVLAVATGILICLVAILEFTLFVWACVDCKAVNMRAVDEAEVEARAHKLAQQMLAEQEEERAAKEQHEERQGQAAPSIPAYDFVTPEK